MGCRAVCLVLGLLLGPVWFGGCERVRAPSEPPNLVLIVVDTLRFDAVDAERTPALAALGADGIVFQRSFSHAPMTLPSHTALFTSRLPHETGIVVNGQVVPEALLLLPEWLEQQGYRTLATASLATLWQREAGRGLDQGFGEFRHAERDYSHGLDTLRVLVEQLDEYGERPDRPLFLFAHFADPHEPYRSFVGQAQTLTVRLDGTLEATVDAKQAPHMRFDFELDAGRHELWFDSPEEDFVPRSLYVYAREDGRDLRVPIEYIEGRRLDKLRRLGARFDLPRAARGHIESWVTDRPTQKEAARRYLEEVRLADEAVAGLVAELKARGLYDSALVIFTSDHGEAFGEHRLNGHSKNLYDELLHVPLVIKPPSGAHFDRITAQLRARAAHLVRHVDLAPTALDIMGLAPLPNGGGRSLLAADPTGRILLAETHTPEAERDSYCLRDEAFKLIFTPELERFELFDLRSDAREEQDIFAKHRQEFEAWQARLEALSESWKNRVGTHMDAEGGLLIDALGY